MDVEMQQKLDSYLVLLKSIKERTEDEQTARVLLSEISKDLRMMQIQQEKNSNGNISATENQIGFLKRLGAEIPEGLTKQQASKLIDATLADRKHGIDAIETPMRIP